jgi:hypothetical protein
MKEMKSWTVVNYVSVFEGVFYSSHLHLHSLIPVLIGNVSPSNSPHTFFFFILTFVNPHDG